MNYFLKKLGYVSQLDRFYTHAKDVPYWNWAQLHDYDRDNISLLLKPNHKSTNKKAFDTAYAMIARSIIDVHGYPEDHIMRVNAMAEIRLKELKYWTTGDRFYINEINVAVAQNKAVLDKSGDPNVTMWQSWNAVLESFGVSISPKEISVLAFYELRADRIKKAKEHQEEIKKATKGKYQSV